MGFNSGFKELIVSNEEHFSKSVFWKLYDRKKLCTNLMCNPGFLWRN
jgi:hypothetical protein